MSHGYVIGPRPGFVERLRFYLGGRLSVRHREWVEARIRSQFFPVTYLISVLVSAVFAAILVSVFRDAEGILVATIAASLALVVATFFARNRLRQAVLQRHQKGWKNEGDRTPPR